VNLAKVHAGVMEEGEWSDTKTGSPHGFVLVSHDPDMTKRTSGSAQADRIMSFEMFLQSL
jgi:hypothetical protein